MANRIPEEVLNEIRANTNIVEVVSTYVSLRKTGRNHVGLCPFHDEKTPSFSVNEDRGFFHCFGCGVGGNVFSFISRIDGLEFPEVARMLADKAGVRIPQARTDPLAREREIFYKLNKVAQKYFCETLSANVGARARRYMESRKMEPTVAARFDLGFAPARGNGMLERLRSLGAPMEKALELGLVGQKESAAKRGETSTGSYFDKFRQRLMFPITDVTGRTVGFGGRYISEDGAEAKEAARIPKYLNSPESVLYKKGSLLYGLYQAKQAVRTKDRVLIVEGYTDLLSLVQSGFDETVAVLGTALTITQLRLVRRFTASIYLFFDGDEAGRKAAIRAFPLCMQAGVSAKGVFLPKGEDPDSFAQTDGTQGLQKLIDGASPLEDFYFAQHAPPAGASVHERAEAAKEALGVLASLDDALARSALLTQVAQRYGINEEEIRRIPRATYGIRPVRDPRSRPPLKQSSYRLSAELELVQLMLLRREVADRVADENVLSHFQEWAEMAKDVVDAWGRKERGEGATGTEDAGIDISPFLERLPKIAVDRVSKMLGDSDSEEVFRVQEELTRDCIESVKEARRKSERVRLRTAIREAERLGDDTRVIEHLKTLRAMGRT